MAFDLRDVLAAAWAYEAAMNLMGAARMRRAFVREYVRPEGGDRIMDIGCGPARLLDYLPPVEYLGFDMSATYIDAAKKRYGDRGRFLQRAVGKDAASEFGTFDVVIALGIVHHLDDAAARDLFSIARASLKPGGRLVALDGCYTEPQSRVARYLASRDRGEYVRDADGYRALAAGTFPRVESHVRTDLLHIPYTHHIMECYA